MTLRLETSASYGVSSGEEASVIHLNEGQMMDSFDVLEFPEIGAEESSSPHPRLEMPGRVVHVPGTVYYPTPPAEGVQGPQLWPEPSCQYEPQSTAL